MTNHAAWIAQELLEGFWDLHDPLNPHGQGNDVGSQYRPAIFYHSAAQCEVAVRSKTRFVGASLSAVSQTRMRRRDASEAAMGIAVDTLLTPQPLRYLSLLAD